MGFVEIIWNLICNPAILSDNKQEVEKLLGTLIVKLSLWIGLVPAILILLAGFREIIKDYIDDRDGFELDKLTALAKLMFLIICLSIFCYLFSVASIFTILMITIIFGYIILVPVTSIVFIKIVMYCAEHKKNIVFGLKCIVRR